MVVGISVTLDGTIEYPIYKSEFILLGRPQNKSLADNTAPGQKSHLWMDTGLIEEIFNCQEGQK